MRSKKLLLFAVTAAAFLVFLSAAASAAGKSGTAYVTHASADLLSEENGKPSFDGIKLPSDGILVFDGAEEADVEKSGDAGGVSHVELEGADYVKSELSGDAGYARFVYRFDAIDASSYDAFAAGFFFSDSSETPPESYRINIVLFSSSDSCYYSCTARPNSAVTFFADLKDFSGRDSVTSIEVTVSYDNEDSAGRAVYMANPVLTNTADFSANKALGASSVSVRAGEAVFEGEALTVTPSDGTAVVEADISEDALPECYGISSDKHSSENIPVVYAEVIITGSAGTVSGEFGPTPVSSAENGNASNALMSPSSQTISDGTFSYLFRIAQPELTSYKLMLKNSGNSPFTIESVKFHYTYDETDSSAMLGSITKIAVEGDNIHVEGKLSKSASVEYINSDIGLFTVPATGGDPVLIETIRASSKFSFDVPVSKYPHAAAENYFYVCVIDKDGGEVPASKKQFASSFSMSAGNNTVFGLHSADATGVFESNASRAIVDVNLDRLTGGENGLSSGTVCSRGNGVYYLDTPYLKELDKEIKFYASSDVGVYIRFTSNKPLRWLSFAYNANTDKSASEESRTHGIQLYLAIVSFLCERYPNVVSVIIAPSVNTNPVTGDMPDSLWDYARGTALLARLTYGAGAEINESFFVTIPFAGDKSGSSLLASPELLSAMISEELYRIGQIPWTFMYSSSDSSFGCTDVVITSGRANATCFPSASATCWIPENSLSFDYIVEKFSEICKSAKASGSRAVFLSLMNVSSKMSMSDYSMLKSVMLNDGSYISDTEAVPYDKFDTSGFTGSHILWDFTSSYNTLGWSAGSGVSTFATSFKYDPVVLSGGDNPRVLRCTFSEDGDSSYGIILCTLNKSVSFASSPYIEFDFSVTSDTPSDITFIFGCDDNRVEFHSSCPAGDGEYKMLCDLEDYTSLVNEVSYISVLVYSDSVVTLDLSNITSHSRLFSSKELDERFADNLRSADKVADGRDDYTLLVLVCAVSAVGSVFAVVHCYHLDKDRKTKNLSSKRNS